MSKYKYNPMTPGDLQTYSLKSRPSKVDINDFAKCWSEEESFGKFINSLPDILAGRGFYFVGHHEIILPLLAAALKAD